MAKKKSSPTPEDTPKQIIKRKHIRFTPDPPTTALIMTDEDGKFLKTPIPCIVIEESYGGCGLVAPTNPLIEKDSTLLIRVGNLPDMLSQIRWVKIFDSKVCYFGIQYKA